LGKELFFLLFRDKPVQVLLALNNNQIKPYASSVAKAVDCTYPHIVKILAEFKQHGIISVSVAGRIKHLTLTAKGQKIARKIVEVQTFCR